MNIARIVNGVVVNIEVADQKWIDAQDDPAAFVPYDEATPAAIGWRYESGQFVRPAEPDTITVPLAAIDALTLTDKERESLGLEQRA